MFDTIIDAADVRFTPMLFTPALAESISAVDAPESNNSTPPSAELTFDNDVIALLSEFTASVILSNADLTFVGLYTKLSLIRVSS